MSDKTTEKIIGAAIEVHRLLGPGLLESNYEEALCLELTLRGVSGQRVDLLVEGEIIVELKAVAAMKDIVGAQVLSYLKATRLKRALLINFGEKQLINGVKRFSL